jgi:hypothetical protein
MLMIILIMIMMIMIIIMIMISGQKNWIFFQSLLIRNPMLIPKMSFKKIIKLFFGFFYIWMSFLVSHL